MYPDGVQAGDAWEREGVGGPPGLQYSHARDDTTLLATACGPRRASRVHGWR